MTNSKAPPESVNGSGSSVCSTALTGLDTVNRCEVVRKMQEILDTATKPPAEELKLIGGVLIRMGEILEGVSPNDAKAILRSVAELNGIKL